MRVLTRRNPIVSLTMICVFGLVLGSSYAWPAQSATQAASSDLDAQSFRLVAPQGFGDRQNSVAWSMAWWKGSLYVGTSRSLRCVEAAAIAATYPELNTYPPKDAEIECTPAYQDLPLRAEIWRWTPGTTPAWVRVFQSPNDVPIPGHEGKFVARDIGFRSMIVFTEADGSESLYAGGVSSKSLNDPGFDSHLIPSPRILRSTDGVTWTAVPQDPGTMLGEFERSSFRDMAIYKGRLYVVGGTIRGEGVLLEAANPAGGNDNFRRVTPPEMDVYAVSVLNDSLYVGLAGVASGYQILRTDATGTPPYTYATVVSEGGYLRPFPSHTIVTMFPYQGRLYAGTDRPAELLRVNPDDSWDVVVGKPRDTPRGYKYPLSGMDAGFDFPLNAHMWRIGAYQDTLYVGTNDSSSGLITVPELKKVYEPKMGFDLFSSPDGWHFGMITRTGFGDLYNFGVRTFAATPYGFFLGSANSWYGLTIWQAAAAPAVYLPLMMRSEETIVQPTADSPAVAPQVSSADPRSLPAVARLEAEVSGNRTILSWEPQSVDHYRIYRTSIQSSDESLLRATSPGPMVDDRVIDTIDSPYDMAKLELEFNSAAVAVAEPRTIAEQPPAQFEAVGVSDKPYFIDSSTTAGTAYLYYVVAESSHGIAGQSSNIVRVPFLAPAVTFQSVIAMLDEWIGYNPGTTQELKRGIRPMIVRAQALWSAGDLAGARYQLEQLQQELREQPTGVEPWRVADLDIVVAKLTQRMRLAEAGIIAPAVVD